MSDMIATQTSRTFKSKTLHLNIELSTKISKKALTRKGAISPLALACILIFALIGSAIALIYSGSDQPNVQSLGN